MIILLGTVLADERCAQMVAEEGLVNVMIGLLKAKQEDDEIVLQIVYVFQKLVFLEATRHAIVEQRQAISYLVDLMHDKNPTIRSVCNG